MSDQLPTQSLIERAKNGDREAFDKLATAFRDRLFSSVQNWSKFQLGPAVDTEEVLQETLIRAHRSLDRFKWENEDSFVRWLCGIAKHALAQVGKDARRGERRAVDDRQEKSDASPSRCFRRNERFDRLEAALEKLTPEHREAILLCRIKGLTSTEVAGRMNCSPAAVRQLLVRALRELKKNFGDTESLHLPDRQLKVEGEDDGK